MFFLTKNRFLIQFPLYFHHQLSNLSTYRSNKNQCLFKKQQDNNIVFDNLDRDVFGNVAEKYRQPGDIRFHLKSENKPDDKDGYDNLFIKRGKKKSPQAYRRILQEYLREKPLDFKKILALHHEHIYEDRYIPEKFWYTMMLEACSRTGQIPKALELFNEMKRYEFKPTKAAVTALLNSCANSSGPKKYSLEKIIQIRDELQLNGYEFNDIHYNCLLKAFSILGDDMNAQSTIEEMQSKGHPLSPEAYSALLMGCINNKNTGLLPARDYFIKLLQTGNRIEVNAFNLFLRAIRDCNVDHKELKQLCDDQSKEKFLFLESKTQNNQIPLLEIREDSSESNKLVSTNNLPNILNGNGLSKIIELNMDSLKFPFTRFQLFGGIEQLKTLLSNYQVMPNLKTITILIDLFPKKKFYEQIKSLMQDYRIKPDITLFNVMIKKAAKSNDRNLCKEILFDMSEYAIEADVMTFGALTFQCTNLHYAKNLLYDMGKLSHVPNSKILGSLFNIACRERDMKYVRFLLDYVEKNNLHLTKIDVEQIYLLLNDMKQFILNIEKNGGEVNKLIEEDYELLRIRFCEILRRTQVNLDEDNPWKSYEQHQTKRNNYLSFKKLMKAKSDIKFGKDPNRKYEFPHSYYDEIDL